MLRERSTFRTRITVVLGFPVVARLDPLHVVNEVADDVPRNDGVSRYCIHGTRVERYVLVRCTCRRRCVTDIISSWLHVSAVGRPLSCSYPRHCIALSFRMDPRYSLNGLIRRDV